MEKRFASFHRQPQSMKRNPSMKPIIHLFSRKVGSLKACLLILGLVLAADSAQAKLVNLADWMEARLGSRAAVYNECVSATGTTSGYSPNTLFDGVSYTRSSGTGVEWHVSSGNLPNASVTFKIPDSVADADLPPLDRYLMHRMCVDTYTWQASPTKWAVFGRNADDEDWTEIQRVDNGFFFCREGDQFSPPCECAHENELPGRVTYRQYKFEFYKTRQSYNYHALRLVELQLVVDDGTPGNVFRVSPDGTGDGSSWAQAANLQTALSAVGREDEIWLKAGDYTLAQELTAPTACAIRGGFAGTETSPDQRTGTARSVFDATAVNNAFVLTDTSFCDYTLENIAITNAILRAIKMGAFGDSSGMVPKSGAGLHATNCLFAHNGTTTTETTVHGRGAWIYTVKGAPVTFVDCVFDRNQNLYGGGGRVGAQNGMGGIAIHFGALTLTRCTFTDNGIRQSVVQSADGRDGSSGAAIYADHASVTATDCLFRGNRIVSNNPYRDGSTIHFGGNPEGTNTFVGCRFVGNSYAQFGPSPSPTIRFNPAQSANGAERMALAIDRCTFAYNLGTTCGGVRMDDGDLRVRNSIFYGNFMTTASGVASDIELAGSASTADIDYSLFASAASIGGAGAATRGANLVYGDPKFLTPLATVQPQVLSTPVSYPTLTAPGRFAADYDLSLINVHVQDRLSPAIDAGDPAAPYANEPEPNGGRMNIGCYANTGEAAISSEAMPEITAASVALGNDYTKLFANVTLATSAEDYVADILLCYGYEKSQGAADAGWAFVDTIARDVHPGAALTDLPAKRYLETGRTIYWRIVVKTVNATVSHDGPAAGLAVTGDLPPHWGKGLGAGYIHVRGDATGAGDGTSWLDAAPTMAEAYALVSPTLTNIVVAGTVPVRGALSTLTTPVSIVGGFTGMEMTFDERTTALSTIDGEELHACLDIANASGCTTVDGICFTRSVFSAVTKTGAGDAVFSNCRFFACGALTSACAGRSLNADGASSATLTITNCVFDRNWVRSGAPSGGDDVFTGTAGNFANFKAVVISDTLYATNGFEHTTGATNGRDSTSAGTLALDNAPLTMTGCRFIGNRHTVHNDFRTQCTMLVSGNSPTVLKNCLFTGNAGYTFEDSTTLLQKTGTLVVNLNASSTPVQIENCTFAYNLASRGVCSGVQVLKGDVTVKNSILYRNQYNTNFVGSTFGGDLRVQADGRATVSHSILTGQEAPWVLAEAGTLTWGDGVQAVDPLFVTTTADFEASIESRAFTGYNTSSPLPGMRFYTASPFFTHHVLGRGGYLDEATGEVVELGAVPESPAIDAGDPTSDASREPATTRKPRINLGFYGNTPWATRYHNPFGTTLILR
jgi:hypothetical protein